MSLFVSPERKTTKERICDVNLLVDAQAGDNSANAF
jgi:hypothetical protein